MNEQRPTEPAAERPPDDIGADAPPSGEPSPARELSLHLLRMLETRMDAAGIALQGETQLLMARLQLKMLAAAAGFIAIWGGIVLLAIALPEPYRVPVLAMVVAGFAGAAFWAQWAAKRNLTTGDVGSMRWFLDGLRQDFEILSRTLAHRNEAPPQAPTQERSPPSDLAA